VRVLRALLIALVLLVLAALVAGEVIVRPLAERAVAEDIQARYALDERPSVSLGGFPFLVRVAMGRLPSADGRLRDLTVEGFTVQQADLRLQDVRFDLVRLASGDGQVSADSGQAEATVSDVDLTNYLAGLGLDFDVRFTPGAVTVGGAVTVAGVEVRVQATGTLAIQDGQLSFAPQSVEAGNASVTVPKGLLDNFRRAVAFTVPIPEVAGVQLTDLELGIGTATLRADLASYLLTG
jgi:hypothetical protein